MVTDEEDCGLPDLKLLEESLTLDGLGAEAAKTGVALEGYGSVSSPTRNALEG